MLAALAMMGAPSLPVTCNPALPFGTDGLTYFHDGAPTRIELSPRVCAGALYLAANPSERRRLVRANPGVTFTQDEGVAAVVMLHEAHHATGDHNEASTECAAMREVPAFVAAHTPTALACATIVHYARQYDALLPPSYHLSGCN